MNFNLPLHPHDFPPEVRPAPPVTKPRVGSRGEGAVYSPDTKSLPRQPSTPTGPHWTRSVRHAWRILRAPREKMDGASVPWRALVQKHASAAHTPFSCLSSVVWRATVFGAERSPEITVRKHFRQSFRPSGPNWTRRNKYSVADCHGDAPVSYGVISVIFPI